MSFQDRVLAQMEAYINDEDMKCAYCGGVQYEADGPCQSCGKNALRDEGFV